MAAQPEIVHVRPRPPSSITQLRTISYLNSYPCHRWSSFHTFPPRLMPSTPSSRPSPMSLQMIHKPPVPSSKSWSALVLLTEKGFPGCVMATITTIGTIPYRCRPSPVHCFHPWHPHISPHQHPRQVFLSHFRIHSHTLLLQPRRYHCQDYLLLAATQTPMAQLALYHLGAIKSSTRDILLAWTHPPVLSLYLCFRYL
jgi:hypothetical protein